MPDRGIPSHPSADAACSFSDGIFAAVAFAAAAAARVALTALAAWAVLAVVAAPAGAVPHSGVTRSGPGLADTTGSNWPEFRGNPQRTGYNPFQTAITKANVATLKPKWTQTVSVGVFANAVVQNNVVYQADFEGNLHAWSLATGAPLWTFTVPANAGGFTSTPTFFNNTLYIGSRGVPGTAPGMFFAIDAATGHVKWQYAIPSVLPYQGFQGSALAANGVIYQGEANVEEYLNTCDTGNQLVAFSQTGPTIISALNLTASAPGYTGADVWSTPSIDPSGNIYFGTGNTCGPDQPLPYADAIMKVSGGNPSMRIGWAFQSPFSAHNDLDFGASPIFVHDMVVEGGKDQYVYALSAATGALVWKRYVGLIIGSAATDGTRVYVPVNQTHFPSCAMGSPCGSLIALNLSNGSVAWSVTTHQDALNNADLAAPVVSQGMVFAAFDSTFYAFDSVTGAKLWSYPTPALVYGGLALVNGGLLGGTFGNGAYYCFTPGGV